MSGRAIGKQGGQAAGVGEQRRRARGLSGERGSTLIFLAIVLGAILAIAALTIDISLLLLTRVQLQNAADAAALAGAADMAQSGGSQSEARAAAIRLAAANRAFRLADETQGNVMAAVTVAEDDVTFPESGVIRVVAQRTALRENPVRSYFLKVLDPGSNATMDVRAAAAASYLDVCGTGCMMPWAPPDRWYDANDNGKYDPHPSSNPDEYYDPDLTGYKAPGDVGSQVTLKYRKANEAMSSEWYYAVNFPAVNKGDPVTGADRYREWIQGCPDPSVLVELDDTLQIEPGNMVGPSQQGVTALIATDPDARWDNTSGRVVDSDFTRSPRIVPVSFMDPTIGLFKTGGRKKIQVAKIASFFIESIAGGNVTGRFLRVSTPGNYVPCTSQSGESFLYKVRLTD
ncbi:MAG: pilus assembly protein TadG-related protein [Candidatus Eisenbacteria bacterium]